MMVQQGSKSRKNTKYRHRILISQIGCYHQTYRHSMATSLLITHIDHGILPVLTKLTALVAPF